MWCAASLLLILIQQSRQTPDLIGMTAVEVVFLAGIIRQIIKLTSRRVPGRLVACEAAGAFAQYQLPIAPPYSEHAFNA